MKKNIRFLLFFLVIGLLLSWPIHTLVTKLGRPAEVQQLAELDEIAHRFLLAAKKGDVEDAQQQILLLAEKFPKQKLPQTLRIESLNAVTQSILAARNNLNSKSISEQQLLWDATRVRVVVDALTHDHQPMWRGYYSSFSSQLHDLLLAAVERDYAHFREQFEENSRLYLAIRPAMTIHVAEGQLKRMDAAYDAISKEIRNSKIEWNQVRSYLRELQASTQTAFIGEDRSTLASLIMSDSPAGMMLSVLTAVVMALGYVAWKKYKGQFRTVS
ncbi:sporulation protein [Brevibacillus composti]|uniref:Sporulation protein n=1 Tax=Brevibacillus composti TaxID=2796470 RepID=A0A7T5JLX6_9BACL|nr:sporulation protein YpjB [Brevibacillus composti]QQE72733.1 sporulation protein [Brevibacillus composti]QUO39811.1 sporulation protein [Brevibacillus composti]